MNNNEYLNEEKYQRTKKKINNVARIVLLIGILIGASLIIKGVNYQNEINAKYSDESKLSITEQIENEKQNLETKKTELEQKGIKYDSFAKYTDGEAYDLKLIVNVLDPSFSYYRFDEYKDNPITAKYCSLKEQLNEVNNDFNIRFETTKGLPFYMFGGFIILASCMISFAITMITKRREITAFTMQQVMPVAQEGIEKMTPTMTNVAKEMAEQMAPTMGEVAKEITKGIKEGLDEKK